MNQKKRKEKKEEKGNFFLAITKIGCGWNRFVDF